jgi:hypothetical protein
VISRSTCLHRPSLLRRQHVTYSDSHHDRTFDIDVSKTLIIHHPSTHAAVSSLQVQASPGYPHPPFLSSQTINVPTLSVLATPYTKYDPNGMSKNYVEGPAVAYHPCSNIIPRIMLIRINFFPIYMFRLRSLAPRLAAGVLIGALVCRYLSDTGPETWSACGEDKRSIHDTSRGSFVVCAMLFLVGMPS